MNADPQQDRQVQIAGFGRRALAATIDIAVAFGLAEAAINQWGIDVAGGERVLRGPAALLFLVLFPAYWIVPEWLFGATLGKVVMGLRVVGTSGEPCSLEQSLKRNVLRLVDFVAAYLVAYLVARSNARRQRLGDLWARTMVIRKQGLNDALDCTQKSEVRQR